MTDWSQHWRIFLIPSKHHVLTAWIVLCAASTGCVEHDFQHLKERKVEGGGGGRGWYRYRRWIIHLQSSCLTYYPKHTYYHLPVWKRAEMFTFSLIYFFYLIYLFNLWVKLSINIGRGVTGADGLLLLWTAKLCRLKIYTPHPQYLKIEQNKPYDEN